MSSPVVAPTTLSPHQKIVVAILAFVQFTVIVDFMILAPLGAQLLEQLHIDTGQFGLVVSAYAISAGLSGLLSATFADRFDRKRLLLVFYVGFIVGTALCGLAPTYETLLAARIVTGCFGGVIGAVSMAIVADVFPVSMRGRVMGTVQTAFSAAQVAGLPAGLALSNLLGWHAPFLVIAAIGAVVGVAMALALRPIRAHLDQPRNDNVVTHLLRTATTPNYLRGFGTTMLLGTSFMLMPLLSAFLVNNLRLPLAQLPFVYMFTGAVTLFLGPLIGKLVDSVGKLTVFVGGSLLGCVIFIVWANLTGPTALWLIVVVNVLMFAANTSRMIAAGALTSALPAPGDRGAYMSINGAVQQLTGGAASYAGGLIVRAGPDGTLARFDSLCFVVALLMLVAIAPVVFIDRRLTAPR